MKCARTAWLTACRRRIHRFLTCTVYNRKFYRTIDSKEREAVPLQVGDVAPDFELAAVTGTERQSLKLSSFRGKKHVVLAFYALDWSPT